MKRIVIEGMDSTGKSTAIDKLLYQFHNLIVVKNELGPEQDFDHWWPAQLMEKWASYVPIHDRFFYSELVYGEVLRGFVKASGPVIRQTEKSLREEALLIYCRPETDRILNTLESKEQMRGVIPNKLKLLKVYDMLMTQEAQFYGQRFLRYNYIVDDPRWLVDKVERYLIDRPAIPFMPAEVGENSR